MFDIFQNYIYFLSSVDFKKAISFAYDTSNYLTFLPNLEIKTELWVLKLNYLTSSNHSKPPNNPLDFKFWKLYLLLDIKKFSN